ncbi:sulfite exporter TauE/SafE family protein [Polynucleobacter necessarius]|uniref:sulfite exporter TauE/SafE family protein n=1 Tax=Polynucleobacter necessarius TaxID=576610 RepID=UPI0013B06206|nr:sulfite exporter TauE/SafE family protein [Polynucleobacter necessarius]
MIQALVLGVFGMGAGVLGGVIGFGTAIILMPALVYFYGLIQAIPVIALVATVANLSRIFLWWSVIQWRPCFVYSLTAIPFTILGVNTLVRLDERLIEMALGAFLILLIPIRRWMRQKNFLFKALANGLGWRCYWLFDRHCGHNRRYQHTFFLAYGLSKGAFLGTEAASTLSILFTKDITFHWLGFFESDGYCSGVAYRELCFGWLYFFQEDCFGIAGAEIVIAHGVGDVDCGRMHLRHVFLSSDWYKSLV